MTPNVAIVHVSNRYGLGVHLWLPLFLLWIPLILLSPLVLLVLFGVCLAGRINPWRTIGAFWGLVCSLPGTNVRVSADGNHVTVRIL